MADQFDIDNLVRQLQELVPTLKSLTSTPSTKPSTDNGTDKIVMAIAKLSAKLDANTNSKTKENLEIAKFTKEIDDATESTKKLTEQQEAATKQQEDAAKEKKKQDDELADSQKRAAMSADELAKYNKELAASEKFNDQVTTAIKRRESSFKQKEIKSAGELINEYGRGVTGTAALREKFDNLGGTSVAANMGFRLLGTSAELLAKSFGEYSKAIYQGKQGAAVAAKSVNTFAQGLGTAAQVIGGIVALIPGFQLLGIGAFAAGTGLKAVGDYAEAAAEMSDRLFSTYQDLSKVGASSADGMRGLGESAVRLGYGLDEVGLKAFSDLISKSSTDLALLSGTVMQGRKDFATFGEDITRGPIGRNLMNMGMKVEDINEGLVSYLGLQARVGQTQNKTQAQLQIGAAAYLKEMDGLTKLTGIQRSEMEQSINKARSVEQFRAKTEAMRASGDSRQIAAADEMERYYAILAKQAPELAQGYAESASGLLTSPAGVKFFQTIGSATGVVEGLSSGVMNATQAYDASNKAGKEFATRFNNLGQAGAVATSGFGNFVEAANLGARANQDLAKSAKEIEEAQKGQKAGADGVVGAQVDLRREQMNTRDNLQKLVELGVKPTTKAMKGFAEFVESITGIPKKVTDNAAPAGVPMSTGGLVPGTAQPTATGAGAVPSATTGGGAAVGNPNLTRQADRARQSSLADKIIHAESRGQNIGNIGGTSSAFGIAQFTKGTFEGLASKAGPTNPLYGKTFEDYKVDTTLQREALRQLMDQNRQFLAQKGLPTSDPAIYLAHFLGATGASRLLSMPEDAPISSAVSEAAMTANPNVFKHIETVGDLKGWASQKMGGVGYAALGGIVPARQGGTKIIAGEAGRNEAFVPLPDGKTIPVTLSSSDSLAREVSGLAKIIKQVSFTSSSNTRTREDLGLIKEQVSAVNSSDALAREVSGLAKIIDQVSFTSSSDSLAREVSGLAKTIDQVSFTSSSDSLAREVSGLAKIIERVSAVNFAEVLSKTDSELTKLVEQLKTEVVPQDNKPDIVQAIRTAILDLNSRPTSDNTTSDPQMLALLTDLVNLQRSNNSTTSRLLQVSTA